MEYGVLYTFLKMISIQFFQFYTMKYQLKEKPMSILDKMILAPELKPMLIED